MRPKLSDDQVLEIRCAYATGEISQDALASAYAISRRTVREVIRGQSYSYLPLVAYGHGPASHESGTPEAPAAGTLYDRIGYERMNTQNGPVGTPISRGPSQDERFRQAFVRQMLRKWIAARETLSKAASISRYKEACGDPPRTEPYLPSDKRCWALTFELVLKSLGRAEYRALAAWFKGPPLVNYTAQTAIALVEAECRRRGVN